jgi:acetyltransferase-like isoleucine patch superfamily enzyme
LHGIRAGRNLILEDEAYLDALSEDGIVMGDNVTIAKKSILVCTGVIRSKGKGIEIGSNSAIGAQSFIGGQGGVTIGSNVIIGPGVRIFSENHRFEDLDMPIRLQGEIRQGVVIGSDCWIGASCTILDGVTIGTGVVIAAGAVVTRNVPDRAVVAGVPARVLRIRGKIS